MTESCFCHTSTSFLGALKSPGWLGLRWGGWAPDAPLRILLIDRLDLVDDDKKLPAFVFVKELHLPAPLTGPAEEIQFHMELWAEGIRGIPPPLMSPHEPLRGVPTVGALGGLEAGGGALGEGGTAAAIGYQGCQGARVRGGLLRHGSSPFLVCRVNRHGAGAHPWLRCPGGSCPGPTTATTVVRAHPPAPAPPTRP